MPTSHLKVNSDVTIVSVEVNVKGDSFALICRGFIDFSRKQTPFEIVLPTLTQDLQLHTKLFFDAVVAHLESEQKHGGER